MKTEISRFYNNGTRTHIDDKRQHSFWLVMNYKGKAQASEKRAKQAVNRYLRSQRGIIGVNII